MPNRYESYWEACDRENGGLVFPLTLTNLHSIIEGAVTHLGADHMLVRALSPRLRLLEVRAAGALELLAAQGVTMLEDEVDGERFPLEEGPVIEIAEHLGRFYRLDTQSIGLAELSVVADSLAMRVLDAMRAAGFEWQPEWACETAAC